jgi:hypothetical protein
MFDLAFGNSGSLREVTAGSYKTEAAFQALCVAAMAVAVAASAFTCTVSTTGVPAQDVNNVMRMFADANFICSLTGSTLTFSW